MFISTRWLARHVDLDGLSPEDIAEDLTIHTAEVEGIEPFAPWLSKVVVGHVVEHGRHPDADKLSVCKVDVGEGEPLQIVCGAPNVGPDMKVAVGKVGTVLPGDLKLKKAKIRGVESRGMICSVRELDLGDDHSGIWVLPQDAAAGKPVAEALGIVDHVIEIDNKSLTHRPDLWGHRGIAGEIAAIRKRPLLPLNLELPATGKGDPYPVRVESAGCSRYLGLPISGVKVEASPDWLKFLLLAVGQRPLDLLVDLSNFVMLDLGQPNHLFDLGRLSDEGIVVRDAKKGEKMATLDGIEREFDPADMLICSGDEPVAVAGVMGGEGSKVAEGSSDLLLEVATFHPTIVRRTAARLGLRTDASTRFEKSLDPTLPTAAAAHLVNTLSSIQPGISLPRPLGDAGTWEDPATTIALRPERVRALLGAPISDDSIQDYLDRLGLTVTRGEPWSVAIPSARATKDLGIEEDLVEEVGRMFGYGNIEEEPLVASIVPSPYDDRRMLARRLADRLAGGARFHEAMTYSFQERSLTEACGLGDEPHVAILNPQIETLDRVRRSVLPSLLGKLVNNRRNALDIRLFEIGKGYLPEEPSERGEPREVHQLALVWMMPRPGKKDRFDAGPQPALQGVLEDLLNDAARPNWTWEKAPEDAIPRWAHPGRAMRLLAGKDARPVAVLSTLEPGIQERLGLSGELDGVVGCAQISLDELLLVPEEVASFRPLPKFPGVKVDVAFALDEATPAGEIQAAITKAGKGLVADVELFDVYRGENLGAGKKSLAYHVLLQAKDRTLSDGDGAKFLGRLERLVGQLGGELRKE